MTAMLRNPKRDCFGSGHVFRNQTNGSVNSG